MKKYLFFLALLYAFTASLFVPPLFANQGSFLVTKSIYLYKDSDKKSKKILTKRNKAYDVTALKILKDNQVFLKISVPSQNHKVNGSGFILETGDELIGKVGKKIKVYGEIPTTKENLTNFVLVNTKDIKLTAKTTRSSHFLGITFTGVNYESILPREYWVLDWGGIYRPDKDAFWLNDAYQKLKKLNLKADKTNKLLLGIIETGYSGAQVKLSWGDPLKEQPGDVAGEVEWTYPNKKVILEKGFVKQQL
ncbi:MAG: hypothetical protein QNL04_00415 [SAR324 cluster bacterium]|nr:hypothetical protein [SAR324 cluster bacterium]